MNTYNYIAMLQHYVTNNKGYGRGKYHKDNVWQTSDTLNK